MRDFSGFPKREVFTLHDLVHRLTLRCGVDASVRNKALMVRAVQDGIRALPGVHDWNYYKRQTRITTTPKVTPTVTYTHATRTMTITSAHTWPSDASEGEIDHEGKTYRILERVDNLNVTLEQDFNPGADLAATEVDWVRRAYSFSREITKVHFLESLTRNRYLEFIPTSEFQSLGTHRWSTGFTQFFTFQNHGGMFGATQLILLPAPIASESLELTATVNPHIPQVELFSGTDGAITQGSTTFTSATGGFTSRLVGSIFRLGRTSTAPTDFNYQDWEFQAFVTSVTNTTLKLSEPCNVPTASARGFSISSPADIDAAVMLDYLESSCFDHFCRNHKHESAPAAAKAAQLAWRLAAARDQKSNPSLYASDDGWHGRWYGRFGSHSSFW